MLRLHERRHGAVVVHAPPPGAPLMQPPGLLLAGRPRPRQPTITCKHEKRQSAYNAAARRRDLTKPELGSRT